MNRGGPTRPVISVRIAASKYVVRGAKPIFMWSQWKEPVLLNVLLKSKPDQQRTNQTNAKSTNLPASRTLALSRVYQTSELLWREDHHLIPWSSYLPNGQYTLLGYTPEEDSCPPSSPHHHHHQQSPPFLLKLLLRLLRGIYNTTTFFSLANKPTNQPTNHPT